MLDLERVVETFSLFSDLSGEALDAWRGMCRLAAARLERRLRDGVDTQAEMEALCTAAAALAYCDFLLLERAGADSEEVAVGEIRLKSGAAMRRDTREIADYFLAGVAHLLVAECPALLAVEEPL